MLLSPYVSELEIGFCPKRIEDILLCISAAQIAGIKSILIGALPEAATQRKFFFYFLAPEIEAYWIYCYFYTS